MFFRTTGKALLSLITRHPDEKSDSVEVAKEALRRASLLGEPIKIHRRLTRYCNKHLVSSYRCNRITLVDIVRDVDKIANIRNITFMDTHIAASFTIMKGAVLIFMNIPCIFQSVLNRIYIYFRVNGLCLCMNPWATIC